MSENGRSTRLYNCTRGVDKTLPKNKVVVFRIMKSSIF